MKLRSSSYNSGELRVFASKPQTRCNRISDNNAINYRQWQMKSVFFYILKGDQDKQRENLAASLVEIQASWEWKASYSQLLSFTQAYFATEFAFSYGTLAPASTKTRYQIKSIFLVIRLRLQNGRITRILKRFVALLHVTPCHQYRKICFDWICR